MEKYIGQNCSCRREQPMESRCAYDPHMKKKDQWHRHEGVDSMQPGMQYVPWQHWDHVYCPEEGLNYGTIFPELNKPFYGKGACRR